VPILPTLLLLADTLTRALGALPAGATDGYARTIRGERFSYMSAHPTSHTSLLVRSVDSTNSARWLTAPVSPAAGPMRHIVFLAAIDVTDPGQTPVRFWLTVNGTHRLAVPQPTTTAPEWSVAGVDGVQLHFRRLMIDRFGDVHGVFTLDVPGTIAPAGAPVTLDVHGENVERQSWFILYTVSMQPTVSAHAEQMLARTSHGNQQTIRLDAWHPFDTTTVAVSINGTVAQTDHLAAGPTTLRVTVPAVQRPSTVRLAVHGVGAEATFAALPLAPVIPREIYLINHDHLDIGYTDLQPAVQLKHERALDSALAYIEASRANPAGARFLWNEEGLWPLQDYLEHRPATDTARVLAAARRGDIALSALYANLMTGLSGSEELVHLLDFTRQLRRTSHVPVTMAMTSDVPGFTWGMVPALASQGVRYLSSGPNETDRIGHTLDAWGDKPFWWIGPSGHDSLLVMFAGRGYSWVNGWPKGRLTVDDANVMSEYMDTLVAHRYPWDIVQVRVAISGDNGMPDGQLSDEVRRWNARFVSPTLVIATLPQMFAAMEKRYGARMPRIRGDLTGYWEDGAVSTLRKEITARQGVARLTEAATLATLRGMHVGAERFDAAWRDALLWDEHTWGADRSVSDPELPIVNAQWRIKQGFANSLDSASRALLSTASRPFRPGIGLDVWNTHESIMRGVVRIPDSLSRAGDRVTDWHGRTFPAQRLRDGSLAVEIELAPLTATNLLIGLGTPTPVTDGVHAASDSLWNGVVAVHVDPLTGAVASVRWQGHELVDQARGGWGRYRYVLGRDTSRAKDTSRSRIGVVENGPLIATLRVTSEAPGAASLIRDVTIERGSAAVTIITHLDKLGVRDKESVHIAFPLAVPGGTVRMEQGLAVVRPDLDQAVGANRNFYPVQRWLDASNATFGVTVVNPDLPLWELNGLTAEAFTQPDGRDEWLTHALPGTELIAYAMNNYWHTNFKADQAGPVSFSVQLVPHDTFNAADATREAIAMTEPPIVTPAQATPDFPVDPPRFSLDNADVVVSSIANAADEKGWIVRLWNPGERTLSTGFHWSGQGVPRLWLSSPAGERRVIVSANRITIPALGAVTVRVDH
jgi:hypothetical protein